MPDQTILAETLDAAIVDGDFLVYWKTASGVQRRVARSSLVGATFTGAGTIATGGFTLTVPATGSAALTNVAQTFTAMPTFSAGATFNDGQVVQGTSGRYQRSTNTNGGVVSGGTAFRITRTAATQAALVRVMFVERNTGTTAVASQYALMATCVLSTGSSNANTFASAVTHQFNQGRKLAVTADTTNGRWDFKIQTTGDADVEVGADHEFFVEILTFRASALTLAWYP